MQMLQLVSTSLFSETSDRMISIKRHRNSLVKLHRLPLELLVKIVKLVTSYEANAVEYFRSLHTLAQVSHMWATTILGTPELWAVVDSDYQG